MTEFNCVLISGTVSPYMELKQHAMSDRAWLWSVPCDFADEEQKAELLAIRFGNVESE